MNKKTIIFISILIIGTLFISCLITPANAVSYYNWIRNPSFEGMINLIEDDGFESGAFNSGVEYGNWSGNGDISTGADYEGVYGVYLSTGEYAWYNLTSDYYTLGSDVVTFDFWAYGVSGGDYNIWIYYSDASYDYDSAVDIGVNTWVHVNRTTLIDSLKYIVAFRISSSSNPVNIDSFTMYIDDVDGQEDVSLTSSPWAIYDFGDALSQFFNFTWGLDSDITNEQSYTGDYSFECIEGEMMPVTQSISLLDSDYIHYVSLWAKTNVTTSVVIAVGLTYASGLGSSKNVTLNYNAGAWQQLIFSNFIYDDDYVTHFTFFVFDSTGGGNSTYIDDVQLMASVPVSWKRFDWSMSPIPVSQGQMSFTAYQMVDYTLTVNVYDSNEEQTESGTYQCADGNYTYTSGSFSNGQFSIDLDIRSSTTVQTLQDEITVIIALPSETINFDISAIWLYVASEGSDESQQSENIISWLTMFMVIFLPALLFSGGIYENNQQPDSMHIPPIFGIIAGLVLSVGIGVYTSLVPLWILILVIIAIVVLIVGMVKH